MHLISGSRRYRIHPMAENGLKRDNVRDHSIEIFVLVRRCTLVRRDPGRFGRRHVIGHDVERLAQRALHTFRFRHPTLALLPKDLPLEPCHLATQADDFSVLRIDQSAYLRRGQPHRQTSDFGRRLWGGTHANIIKVSLREQAHFACGREVFCGACGRASA